MRKKKLIAALFVAGVMGVASAALATAVLGTSAPPPPVPTSPGDVAPKGPRVQVAVYPGLAKYAVFVHRTVDGMVCLGDAPVATPERGGSGCNPANEPLAGRDMVAAFSFEGGPSVGNVSEARVSGLVTEKVAKVAILMSDGSKQYLRLMPLPRNDVFDAKTRVFAHAFNRSDVRAGIAPRFVLAFDSAEREIERQDIGSDLTK